MSLAFHRADADLFVPDGRPVIEALARTTDLGVGAHADDLEFFGLVPIGACRAEPDRWFAGVTCTDGAGSARGATFADLSPAELVMIRRQEQRQAAQLGGYGAVVQLGHPSAFVRSPDGQTVLVDELVAVLEAARPTNVYTHNLADKHSTHVAVAVAVVLAIRRLPIEGRPARLLGCEGWRDLDWLPDHEKVRLDATPHVGLGRDLAAVFRSQIEGAKRYDLAEEGRRRANATYFEPREVDDADEVIVAMDLTPLIRNDDLDPAAFVLAAIERFRREVATALAHYL